MEEKTKSPVYKKWWFWVILVVLALAIVGGIVGGATEGGKEGGKTSGGNAPKSYYIGDAVTVGSLEVTVDSVSDTQLLGTELFGERTNQNFLVIVLTVKNTKNKEATITSSFMKVKRGDAEYKPHSGSIYLEDGFTVLKQIGSGIFSSFPVAFEVPDKSTESEYILRVGDTFDYKDILLKHN